MCELCRPEQGKIGFYVTSKKIKNLEVVNQSNLADHHPLHRIGAAERFSFYLHHFVSQPEPELAEQGQAVGHLGSHPQGGQGESYPGAALPDQVYQ